MKIYSRFLIACIFLCCIISCKKETDVFSTLTINDYSPLQTGKYITYKLDSLVYLNFGTTNTTISYQVKYVTDSLITDNLGRPAYRIFRFIRKTDQDAWQPSGTFMAINDTSTLEFIENNMRFVKLKLPIKDEFSWKGNAFIDTYSLNSQVKYLDDWDYVYTNVGKPENVDGSSFENTLTVNQRDEVLGSPDDPGAYSEVNFSIEKYAYGIGLVYRKFFHSEYQPGSGGPGYFADGSYGVTLTIIDHN